MSKCKVRDLRAAGLRSGGFDGNPATWEITEGRCLQAHPRAGISWDLLGFPESMASVIGGDWTMALIFPFSWEVHHPN